MSRDNIQTPKSLELYSLALHSGEKETDSSLSLHGIPCLLLCFKNKLTLQTSKHFCEQSLATTPISFFLGFSPEAENWEMGWTHVSISSCQVSSSVKDFIFLEGPAKG